MRFLILLCLLVTLAPIPSWAAGKEAARGSVNDEAQRVYAHFGDAIYQVQVIDLASDKKNGIGSGFQFTKDGLLATNYHVVAESIQRPENNRLEYLHEKGQRGALKVLIADVVHDLAILQMDTPGKSFVQLGASKQPKGSKLFSMGNPHDIGFTIVEGIHNGINPDSFLEKIHFSGAINAGMSGGPALTHEGTVAGINVMTGGNAIGFLVPVDHLHNLLAEYAKQPPGFDFVKNADQLIENQLLAKQQETVSLLTQSPWEKTVFGPVTVPGRIHPAFKCWGAQASENIDPYKHFWSTCYNEDNIFLDDEFSTGTLSFRYDTIEGKKSLALPRFYKFYEQTYASLGDTGGYGDAEENLTNFECKNKFTRIAGEKWKTSFCVRQYKKYPKLYDTMTFMALVGKGRSGMLASATFVGVSKENALKLTQRFLSEMTEAKAKPSAPAPEKDGKKP